MATVTYNSINVPDKNIQLIQDATKRAIDALGSSLFQKGSLLTGVSLTSGQDNLIAHKLGYTPQICVPCLLSANTTFWQPTSTSLANASADSQFINIRCSTSCTASFWVA